MKIIKFYELILLILCLDMMLGNLFVDDSIKFALFEDYKKNVRAGNFAIGNVEGLKVDVNDGIATLTTTEIWHGWHHASLGQAPPTSSLNSYISFLDLATIKFKIKSNQITTSEIKVYLEIRNGGFGLDRKLIDLGYNEILDWTEIEISVKSFRSLKMSVAFAISLNGGQLDRTMQIKDIAFLNDNGGNANVLAKIEWPKETGTDTPPEPPMEIGTKIKKNGIELTLEWSDEFIQSDILPDKTKWGYDVGDGLQENTDGTNPHNSDWGNGEAQWYTANDEGNAFVSDGTLKIRAAKETFGSKKWSSSRLVTRNLKEFKYGYFEFRVKLPESQGFWPAIWMLRHDIYDPNGTTWPTCGEIDILESSTNIWGLGKVFGTLHCDAGHSGNPIYTQGLQMSQIEKKWHLYGLYWTPNSIYWYYDDQLVGKYNPKSVDNNAVWPFYEDFYIIMNLAVGGNLGGYIPDNVVEAIMEVDYVRYFSGSGEGNEGDNGPGNKPDEHSEIINFEEDKSLKSPIGFIATDKGSGVIDVVWGNDPSVLADLYVVMVDGVIVSQAGGPRVVTVTVSTGGEHTFGVAAVYNGKASVPNTAVLNVSL
jgi:beta-glucanase (GH16 family)